MAIKFKLEKDEVQVLAQSPPKKEIRVPPLRMDKVQNRYRTQKFTGNINNNPFESSSNSSMTKMSSLRSARYQSLTATSEMKKNSKREPSKEPKWNSTIKVVDKGPPVLSSLIRRPNRGGSSMATASNMQHSGTPTLPVA